MTLSVRLAPTSQNTDIYTTTGMAHIVRAPCRTHALYKPTHVSSPPAVSSTGMPAATCGAGTVLRGWHSTYCGTDASRPVRRSTASLAMPYACGMSLLRRNSVKKARAKMRAAPSLLFMRWHAINGTSHTSTTWQEGTPALSSHHAINDGGLLHANRHIASAHLTS
eukprot:266027-Prymnesium_polylepis.1